MLIQKMDNKFITEEYGCKMRRVYPNDGIKHQTPFGSAWAIVEVGSSSAPHSHHEAETFYITQGKANLIIDGKKVSEVEKGDVIYVDPYQSHQLTNIGDEELIYVCIWWETKELAK